MIEVHWTIRKRGPLTLFNGNLMILHVTKLLPGYRVDSIDCQVEIRPVSPPMIKRG